MQDTQKSFLVDLFTRLAADFLLAEKEVTRKSWHKIKSNRQTCQANAPLIRVLYFVITKTNPFYLPKREKEKYHEKEYFVSAGGLSFIYDGSSNNDNFEVCDRQPGFGFGCM